MVHSFLIGVGGMVAIAAVWFGILYWIRKNSPDKPPDCDLMDGMGHGCGSCDQADTCDLHHQH